MERGVAAIGCPPSRGVGVGCTGVGGGVVSEGFDCAVMGVPHPLQKRSFSSI